MPFSVASSLSHSGIHVWEVNGICILILSGKDCWKYIFCHNYSPFDICSRDEEVSAGLISAPLPF